MASIPSNGKTNIMPKTPVKKINNNIKENTVAKKPVKKNSTATKTAPSKKVPARKSPAKAQHADVTVDALTKGKGPAKVAKKPAASKAPAKAPVRAAAKKPAAKPASVAAKTKPAASPKVFISGIIGKRASITFGDGTMLTGLVTKVMPKDAKIVSCDVFVGGFPVWLDDAIDFTLLKPNGEPYSSQPTLPDFGDAAAA